MDNVVPTSPACVLCATRPAEHYYGTYFKRSKLRRDYFRCGECGLIFVHPEQRLNESDEKGRCERGGKSYAFHVLSYDTHNNDPNVQGYADWLRRLLVPLRERHTKLAVDPPTGVHPGFDRQVTRRLPY